jgi:hypothetical protein
MKEGIKFLVFMGYGIVRSLVDSDGRFVDRVRCNDVLLFAMSEKERIHKRKVEKATEKINSAAATDIDGATNRACGA